MNCPVGQNGRKQTGVCLGPGGQEKRGVGKVSLQAAAQLGAPTAVTVYMGRFWDCPGLAAASCLGFPSASTTAEHHHAQWWLRKAALEK